jgi:hypothetical protein
MSRPTLSAWRTVDGLVLRPTDVLIAVMGVTGTGKSTFISHLTDSEVEISGKMESCLFLLFWYLSKAVANVCSGTQEVTIYACDYSESSMVYLVDTPGFDDSGRSDTEVLREVAAWLTDSYSTRLQLNGIIYLHRISDNRFGGSAKKNLLMFKKLCGADVLKNIVLATTMWETTDEDVGKGREAELIERPDYWGWMHQQGSHVTRHQNTRESAMRLVDIFASSKTTKHKVVLGVQKQMVTDGKTLDETDVGMELRKEFDAELEKFTKELRNIKIDMQEALNSRDKEAAAMHEEQKREMDAKIRHLDQEREELKISMEQLHEIKITELEERLEAKQQESQLAQQVFERQAREQAERHQEALNEAERQRRRDEERQQVEMAEREVKLRQEMEREAQGVAENAHIREMQAKLRWTEEEGQLRRWIEDREQRAEEKLKRDREQMHAALVQERQGRAAEHKRAEERENVHAARMEEQQKRVAEHEDKLQAAFHREKEDMLRHINELERRARR